MLQYLRQLFEYTAYVLAPALDTRIDLTFAIATAAILVLLFAALVALPRRARIAFPAIPVASSTPRVGVRVAPLRSHQLRTTVRPRAPATAV